MKCALQIGDRVNGKICPPVADKIYPLSEGCLVLWKAMDPVSCFGGVITPSTNTVVHHSKSTYLPTYAMLSPCLYIYIDIYIYISIYIDIDIYIDIYLYLYISIYRYIYIYLYLSMLSIDLSIYAVYRSIYLCCLSIYLSILSIDLYVYLSRLSICVSLY